ncbi:MULTISPECIES: flavodoxin family protein [Treponema]|uniref:NADPH-dependent FMN reductase n=1 Tax=Treponema saccharophilum DSM 2985 TaxID=907348 RepID=H7EPP3_9SPIR|nr:MULTISPECIES: flavodoxin family protein [Treponema]EIC00444.1 NADPH-dependent FMN reductase [Treponema saccharophilum DSM 2985]MBQ5538550.1 flavodoxin family protein [Treponema sp.]BDC94980.1 FMN reductase [Treponema saccharophilum]
MKVILFNGSRNEKGSTYTALSVVAKELEASGIDSEIFWVGGRALTGEIDALVDEAVAKMKEADGMVLGSPVYYASPSGELIAFLDRFYWKGEGAVRFKPAASVTVARRGGTTACLDVLNKYTTYAQQPVVTSRYWNMIHGSNGDDVMKDEEGLQILRTLGRNMAWILKSIEAGKKSGVAQPEAEKKIFTNFIR